MRIQELNHVAIYVTNVQRSVDFYGGVLKLESMSRPAFDFPGAWFRLGTTQELHLIGDRGEPYPEMNRNNHFALRVDDIDGWQRHLTESRANFMGKKLRPDGAWQIFVTDPDGHTIELFMPA